MDKNYTISDRVVAGNKQYILELKRVTNSEPLYRLYIFPNHDGLFYQNGSSEKHYDIPTLIIGSDRLMEVSDLGLNSIIRIFKTIDGNIKLDFSKLKEIRDLEKKLFDLEQVSFGMIKGIGY